LTKRLFENIVKLPCGSTWDANAGNAGDVLRHTVYNSSTILKGEQHAIQSKAVEAHQSGSVRGLSLQNGPHGVGARFGTVTTTA
jgi:hypothetical protein